MTRLSVSDEQIRDLLRVNYGVEVVALERLAIGADADAVTYRADCRSQSYFVKIRYGTRSSHAIKILEFMHESGIAPVIPPIKTLLGELSHEVDNVSMLMYPFIEGQNGFSRDLTSRQWFVLGDALRRIHDLGLPPSIPVRRESYSPKWRAAVQSLYTWIEYRSVDDHVASKFATFMIEHAASIHEIAQRAEQLSRDVGRDSTKAVLCHSDLHGGNVLLDGNDTLYIVDWDDPMLAGKERDLMFIGGGVGNVWNKPHEEEAFYQGYGAVEIDRKLLAYYRHERILEDIALIGHRLFHPMDGGANREEMYGHFTAMFDPRGVVAIALGM